MCFALPRLSRVKLKSLILMVIVFKKNFESTKFIIKQLRPCKFAIDKIDINIKAYKEQADACFI